MEEPQKFRVSDFIPFCGAVLYTERNRNNYLPGSEGISSRDNILSVYNVALVFGTLIGLEKLFS